MDYLCHKVNGMIIFPKYDIPKKSEVIEGLGTMEHSYASTIISRMYDYYFKGATCFSEEYKNYYSNEFGSLEQYIEEHYNINHNDSVLYASRDYCMKKCSTYAIDKTIETILEDVDFRRVFSEAVGGIYDEDPDGLYY